ncbi:uncharacterized protein [Physcomitrium patens]|uniref:DUF3511 domain-containing protein n=1 Tax=Physcomitrium patens TaxID=3218 RepID=A9SJ36_PHYPA|nr:hypothetical protein PHYPA_002412 [Physcomitrium patens]
MVLDRRYDDFANNNTYSDFSNSKSKMPRSNAWATTDPEIKRKKRVAKYKVFTLEGKVKDTVRSSCRWIKNKYLVVRYGQC